MKLIIILSLTMSMVLANPTKPIQFEDDRVYTANNTCYIAEYDIVDVHLPTAFIDEHKVFIIQADVKNNIYRGAYLLNLRIAPSGGYQHNVTAHKLLNRGKCITSDDKRVYFGTTDGIYTYNFSNSTVEKYGTITANIRDIEKDKSKDLIYIVTEDNKLYLVTESGNKMVEHDSIRNVQEIATDANNNLYFYEKHEDPERHQQFFEKYGKPKVLVGDNILNISGLPDRYTNMKLASFWANEAAVLVLENMIYSVFPNGTSDVQQHAFLDIPTAWSVESGLVQLFGQQKKLYCCVVDLGPVIEGVIKGLTKAFTNFFQMSI